MGSELDGLSSPNPGNQPSQRSANPEWGRAMTQSEVEGFADWGFAMLAVGAAIQGANAILPGHVTQNGSFDDVKAHGAKRPSPCGNATRRVNPRNHFNVNV